MVTTDHLDTAAHPRIRITDRSPHEIRRCAVCDDDYDIAPHHDDSPDDPICPGCWEDRWHAANVVTDARLDAAYDTHDWQIIGPTIGNGPANDGYTAVLRCRRCGISISRRCNARNGLAQKLRHAGYDWLTACSTA